MWSVMIEIQSIFSCLFKVGGPILALLLSIQAHGSFGMHGEITGFNLNSCGLKNCLEIKSSKAFTGMLPSSYAFDSAFITITDKKTKKSTTIQTDDAFFDSVSNKIFIRRMVEYKNAEAIYDLSTEKLSIYFMRSKS